MKPYHFLVVALLAVACAPQSNETRVAPQGGGTQIRFEDGRNCWQGRCLNFSRRDRWISVSGRNPVLVPKDIDLRDGYVTEAEFQRMFATASMALSRGAGSRR